MFKCKLCEQVFEDIPINAVQLGKALGNKRLYLFPDGSVHELYAIGLGRRKNAAGDKK
jgi:hypothetical protein